MTLYRWARAYAETPGGGGRVARIGNASAGFSVGELAKESLGRDAPQTRKAVQNALLILRQSRVIEVVTGRGKPGYFIPHAIGVPAFVPQHIWRVTPKDRRLKSNASRGQRSGLMYETLDGKALWLALVILARTHLPISYYGPADRKVRAALEKGRIAHPLKEVIDQLPLSRKSQRAAVDALLRIRLVQEFRTGGVNYLLLKEPDP